MSRAVLLCLIIPIAILFSFGLLMIFNTSAAQIIDRSLALDPRSIFFKQFLYGITGLLIGILIFRIGYEAILKYSMPALVAVTVLLALLFVPGVGQVVNGARRWIGIFGFTFQPSECAKILIPAAYIQWALKIGIFDSPMVDATSSSSIFKNTDSPFSCIRFFRARPRDPNLYQNRPQTWNLDRAKAPRFNDRKRLSINNTEPFAIVESRELSRGPKSKFVADSGIIKTRSKKRDISFLHFLKILGFFSIPLALILLEPDNGTTAIILSLLLVLFLLTRIYLRYWALPLLLLVSVGGVVAYQMPHVHDRIQIYLHPEIDLKGKGHQPHQAKIAAGSGGLFGKGIGESLQKMNYLPEARNDYIAAIFAEETGFIGIMSLIVLYMTFSFAGFLISLRAKEPAGFLLAGSLTFLISLQAFLNLGIVSALLPSKGMTLPFFSQGGTSLIVNIAALFILLDIARKTKKEPLYD